MGDAFIRIDASMPLKIESPDGSLKEIKVNDDGSICQIPECLSIKSATKTWKILCDDSGVLTTQEVQTEIG